MSPRATTHPRGTRWLAGTTDHACPVCGLMHSLPLDLASGAEVKAFRAKLGRVLGYPRGRMLDQKRAAALLGVRSRQLYRYERGLQLMPKHRSDRMRALVRELVSADAVREALGEHLAKHTHAPRAKRYPAPYNNI